ncbi:MFS transporter [Paraburkholderia monticola]|uniref:MFS transporter n=1 Tax=Paraburkholderia monticola TaxID=1399968 RepID=A0A149PG83_9BURK|nr:MFS transporter [Paraburkholderia monticola]KXU84049.1 MFS transporter [Paraburkholderia monticola]
MSNGTRAHDHQPGMVRIIATSSLGTMLEYYDFFVYVALTATLTHLFLPDTDKIVATFAGVATFGIAYVARPLGTIIFNPMSDRIGRKRTFVITLALMGIATVGIGCLPTHAVAGVAAPVALITLRIIQGVALGGEYGSAVVYVMEHAPEGRKGMSTSVLQGTASIGLLLALAIVSILKVSLVPSSFEAWGWRVPFVISAPIVAVATWIRLGMTETPIFSQMKAAGRLSKNPLQDTLSSKSSWKMILVAMFGAQGGTSVSLYTSIVYMLYFLQNVLKVDPTTANLCLGAAILIAAPFYPAFGKLSDAIGRARVMLIGILLWIVAVYPAFAGIKASASSAQWVQVSLLIAVLAILTAMIMAPLPAFIAECFPPQSRTTGFGLAQQLGNVLFGGFLPLISLTLVDWTGNPLAGVGYSIASLLPCLAVTWVWGLKQDARVRRLERHAGQPASGTERLPAR